MTNRENKIKAKYSWVKGQKDDSKSSNKVSLLTQLNVEEDTLVGKFQENFGRYSPRVPVLLTSSVMLAIRGVSITSHYKHHLHRAYTEPRYAEHLQEKFKWDNNITESISWKCLSIAIRRTRREGLITKCCNDILLTALRLKTMGYQDTDTCCMCSAQETFEHMLRCNHNTRIQWRRQTVQAMQRSMKKHNVEARIIDVFGSCITDWLGICSVDPSKCNYRYSQAIVYRI